MTNEQQNIILEKLKESDTWQSAFELRANLNTMNALVRRGLVKEKREPGAIFSPRTNILFKIV